MLKFKTIFEPIIDENSCSCPNCKQLVTPYKPVDKCVKCGTYIDFTFMEWSRFDNNNVILNRLREIINDYDNKN